MITSDNSTSFFFTITLVTKEGIRECSYTASNIEIHVIHIESIQWHMIKTDGNIVVHLTKTTGNIDKLHNSWSSTESNFNWQMRESARGDNADVLTQYARQKVGQVPPFCNIFLLWWTLRVVTWNSCERDSWCWWRVPKWGQNHWVKRLVSVL